MEKTKIIEAYILLDNFLLDLIVGTRSLEIFNAPVFKNTQYSHRGLVRMSISHIILNLSKLMEFYEKYKDYIPDEPEIKMAWKKLYKDLRGRDIKYFRNKVVGHIWDKKKGKPLGNNEVEKYYQSIIGPQEDTFFQWVNNTEENIFPQTVRSVVEYTRKRMLDVYKFTKNDFLIDQDELGRLPSAHNPNLKK